MIFAIFWNGEGFGNCAWSDWVLLQHRTEFCHPLGLALNVQLLLHVSILVTSDLNFHREVCLFMALTICVLGDKHWRVGGFCIKLGLWVASQGRRGQASLYDKAPAQSQGCITLVSQNCVLSEQYFLLLASSLARLKLSFSCTEPDETGRPSLSFKFGCWLSGCCIWRPAFGCTACTHMGADPKAWFASLWLWPRSLSKAL